MPEHKPILTVGQLPNRPGKLLAILSLGSPRLGDETTTVLSVEVVDTVEQAHEWADKMIEERPWETRQ